jgi:hypothetical protein
MPRAPVASAAVPNAARTARLNLRSMVVLARIPASGDRSSMSGNVAGNPRQFDWFSVTPRTLRLAGSRPTAGACAITTGLLGDR